MRIGWRQRFDRIRKKAIIFCHAERSEESLVFLTVTQGRFLAPLGSPRTFCVNGMTGGALLAAGYLLRRRRRRGMAIACRGRLSLIRFFNDHYILQIHVIAVHHDIGCNLIFRGQWRKQVLVFHRITHRHGGHEPGDVACIDDHSLLRWFHRNNAAGQMITLRSTRGLLLRIGRTASTESRQKRESRNEDNGSQKNPAR